MTLETVATCHPNQSVIDLFGNAECICESYIEARTTCRIVLSQCPHWRFLDTVVGTSSLVLDMINRCRAEDLLLDLHDAWCDRWPSQRLR